MNTDAQIRLILATKEVRPLTIHSVTITLE